MNSARDRAPTPYRGRVPLTFPDPPLTANGIVLRRHAESDVPWITDACADPEMSHWIPLIPCPYTEADARSFVEETKASWDEGSKAPFVIADSERGQGLGLITLHLSATDPGLAGVGYWLCRAARGRGAATAALRLVAGWAFATLGIERLHLTTHPDNYRSQAVAERAGFQREGLLRLWAPTRDGRRDSVMFSLLAHEFDQAS